MNERIKELWEEATVSTWPRPGKFTAGEYDYHLEKFAELIIDHATECVRDVLREEDSDLSYTAATQVQNKIKQFFGVKE